MMIIIPNLFSAQIMPDGNVSRSVLRITPKREDNGCMISCRAENPLIPRAVMEDSRKFIVYCK